MRISTVETDAGFEAAEGRFFDVSLDGVPVSNVITADEELCLIVRDTDPMKDSRETLHGVVKIVPKGGS